jgi:RimJ/RimL family protein N-acetyltransferase
MPETLGVSLRPVTAADSRRLWELRNEETVRRVSFGTEPIPFDRHQRWLAARLAAAAPPMFMVDAPNAGAVGYVRFDAAGAELHVSVALAAEARGRGLGPAALRAAMSALRAGGLRQPVVALVRSDNPRSVGAFLRAGFVPAGERPIGALTVTAVAWPDA